MLVSLILTACVATPPPPQESPAGPAGQIRIAITARGDAVGRRRDDGTSVDAVRLAGRRAVWWIGAQRFDDLDAVTPAVRGEIAVALVADRWVELTELEPLFARAAADPDAAWRFELAVLTTDVEAAVWSAPTRRSPAGTATPGDALGLGARVARLAGRQREDGSFVDDAATPTPAQRIEATAWALLALLESGSTMRAGPHRAEVQRAVSFLSPSKDDPIALVTADRDLAALALATLAVAHTARLSSYRLLESRARSAAAELDAARDPAGLFGAPRTARAAIRATLAWSEVRALDDPARREDLRGPAASWLRAQTFAGAPLARAAVSWFLPEDEALRAAVLEELLAAQTIRTLDPEALWMTALVVADCSSEADRHRFEMPLHAELAARAGASRTPSIVDDALMILASVAAGRR